MTPRTWVDPFVLAVGAAIAALDQITKHWIVGWLGPGSPVSRVELIGEWVRFSYTTNTGAAFGLFQDKTPILTIASLIAVPVLALSPLLFPRAPLLMRLSLGLLLGGAIGNLIDRLRLGYVIDFVDVGIGQLRWPAFNVADSSFVIGICILVLYLFFGPGEDAPEAADPASSRRAEGRGTSYAPENG